MGRFKLLLVAFAITISNSVFANPAVKFIDGESVSMEIQRTLEEVRCEERFEVTVFFSISEDNKIGNLAIASPNEEVNNLLQKKLEGQKLYGDFWQHGKIYEFSVIGSV